ncbi:hypothetical protein Pdw03_4702 [Penicillium digitatum]|uniref:Uncharacterized protein n=1 Tax=Penicillium digitatum TaxID=36651 RepID=A0A7T6XIM4_PENDI|nr:hypothetical protein Pdw03_4702 [Penicillium digitatum]
MLPQKRPIGREKPMFCFFHVEGKRVQNGLEQLGICSRYSSKAPMVMAQVSNASRNDRSLQRSANDQIPTAKQRNWNEMAGSRIETLILGPVDRTSILELLISKCASK